MLATLISPAPPTNLLWSFCQFCFLLWASVSPSAKWDKGLDSMAFQGCFRDNGFTVAIVAMSF